MKTTIEINEYEIVIEEMDGKIMVSAMKDEEVVEEFELEAGEVEDYDDEEGDDMSAFGEDDEDMEEEDDFEDMEGEDDDNDDDMEEESKDDESGKLESFSYFVKKRKK